MSFGHLRAAIWHRWTIIRGDAVKDKRYAEMPEVIDALKDNIREAIGEMQLHTIDNLLKNWTDRVGYCMANRGSHLNEITYIHNWSLQLFSQDYWPSFLHHLCCVY